MLLLLYYYKFIEYTRSCLFKSHHIINEGNGYEALQISLFCTFVMVLSIDHS